MSLIEAFLATTEARAEAPALISPDGRATSYADLARASAQRALAFSEAGVEGGDSVLVAQSVRIDLYTSLLALFRIGAVAVFPEPGAGLAGIRYAIAATAPKAMIAGARARLARAFVPELASLPLLPKSPRGAPRGDMYKAPRSQQAPALITFTSGSTARPKGVVRTREFLLLQHRLLEGVRRTSPGDVDLISLPMFILSNLAAGATSVIPAGDLRRPARMDGAALRRQISAHRINRVVAPPALCARLPEGPLPGITALFTGGGPVFPNLWRALRASAPDARICAVYGSTEAEPIAHVDLDGIASQDWEAMARGEGLLAGSPIPEIALSLAGREIEVAGPHVNRGYLDPADDAETKIPRDGCIWHRTGDCGRLDADGRLWLLGRKTASAGGAFPFAIETAALSWPGVRQAALLADPQCMRLAIAGAKLDLPDLRRRASRLGVGELVPLRAIPTDRRHNSKIDYARLRTLMRA